MKRKYLFASSLLALTLGMTVTSCDEIDNIDDPIELPAIETSDLDIAAKEIISIAASLGTENAKTITLAEHEYIKKIVTLADGSFIADLLTTRASSTTQVTGNYVVRDGKIICTIVLDGKNVTVEIPQEKAESIVVDGTPVTCQEEEKKADTPQSISLCRSWYPSHYQAVVYSDKGTISGQRKVFGNYEARTLAELQRIIGVETLTNIDLLGGELQKISFLNDGTIVTTLDHTSEVFTWQWTKESTGEFTASFGSDAKFQNLPCYVRYQAGQKANTAEFVLECEVEVKGKNNEYVKGYVMAIITATDQRN